jgi:hypothetical protein
VQHLQGRRQISGLNICEQDYILESAALNQNEILAPIDLAPRRLRQLNKLRCRQRQIFGQQ